MRLKIIENIILFFFVLIILSLIYIQVIKGSFYYDLSVNNRIRVIPIEGPRGKITDRNGLVLADNQLAYHVAVISQDIDDAEELFRYLGETLNKDPARIKTQFYRKRKTPFEPVILASNVDTKTIMKIEEGRFQHPGLVIESSYQRKYPFADSAAHAVGYVGKIDAAQAEVLGEYGYNSMSEIGKTGVEKTYDSILRAEPGGRQIEINSRGQEVRLLGLKDPVPGKDLQLTIDQRVQAAAVELMDSRPGAVVVMDLDTGELLSVVSSPTFDPNVFIDKGQQDRMVSYLQDSRGPLLNRAVANRYPPGSVFKIPVALAAIELHKITEDLTFDCPGYYMLGQAKFGCAHVHGSENLNQAIAHSCNVYFFHIGQMITAKVIEQYAKAFGLGRVTGVDLPFEVPGQVIGHAQNGKRWFTGNTLNFSIGQGDTLSTPLQLTVMMAAVANDGIILKPHIAKVIDDQEILQKDNNKLPKIRLHKKTWNIIQKGMRSVVTDPEGTGHLLSGINGMTIYGKTGTAQAGTNKANHAWFAGYLNSPKRNLAFCVLLEHGGSSSNAVDVLYKLITRMQSLEIL